MPSETVVYLQYVTQDSNLNDVETHSTVTAASFTAYDRGYAIAWNSLQYQYITPTAARPITTSASDIASFYQPATVPGSSNTDINDGGGGSSGGQETVPFHLGGRAIGGIVGGVLGVLLSLLVSAICLCIRRRKMAKLGPHPLAISNEEQHIPKQVGYATGGQPYSHEATGQKAAEAGQKEAYHTLVSPAAGETLVSSTPGNQGNELAGHNGGQIAELSATSGPIQEHWELPAERAVHQAP